MTGKAQTKRSVVFVLGMHRSGTSALSKMLSLLGCDLPKSLMPGTDANVGGYWESTEVMALNDAILSSGGSRWDDWLPFNKKWYQSPVYQSFIDRGIHILTEEFGSSPLFVLKDPRCARLVPFWMELFDKQKINPLIIIPLRNPIEVASSLVQRDNFHIDVAILLWLRHVLDAEYDTRGASRSFSTYEQLLNDWSQVANAMQERLNISWPSMTILSGAKIHDYIDIGSRHYQLSSEKLLSDSMINSWLRDTYAIMLRWASDGEDSSDYQVLDRVRDEFNTAGPAFVGITQSLMEREKQVNDMLNTVERKRIEICDLNENLNIIRNELAVTQNIIEQQNHLVVDNSTSYQDLQQAYNDALAKVAQIEKELADAQQVVIEANHCAEVRVNELNFQIAEVEGALRQREEEIALVLLQQDAEAQTLRDEMNRLTTEAKAQAANEVRELTAQLVEVEGTLRQREEEIALVLLQQEAETQKLRDEMQWLTNEAKAQAANEVRELSNQFAQVESTLRQREEEIDQTILERNLAIQYAQDLEDEKSRIDALRKDAEKWVFRLAGDRQKSEVLIEELKNHLRSKDDQLKTIDRELNFSRAKLQRLPDEADIISLKMANRELEKIAADYHSQTEKYINDINNLNKIRDELQEMIHNRNERISIISNSSMEHHGKKNDNQEEVFSLRETVEINKIEIDCLILALTESQKISDDYFNQLEHYKNTPHDISFSTTLPNEKNLSEIAKKHDEVQLLSTLLEKQRKITDQKSCQTEWLQRVIPIITRVRWWSNLVNDKYKMKRNYRVLLRKGLFDADAYMARYHDVIEHGMDPLQHYILHGMKEGRSPMG